MGAQQNFDSNWEQSMSVCMPGVLGSALMWTPALNKVILPCRHGTAFITNKIKSKVCFEQCSTDVTRTKALPIVEKPEGISFSTAASVFQIFREAAVAAHIPFESSPQWRGNNVWKHKTKNYLGTINKRVVYKSTLYSMWMTPVL